MNSRKDTLALAQGSDRPPAEVFDVALLDLDGVVYVGPDADSRALGGRGSS